MATVTVFAEDRKNVFVKVWRLVGDEEFGGGEQKNVRKQQKSVSHRLAFFFDPAKQITILRQYHCHA